MDGWTTSYFIKSLLTININNWLQQHYFTVQYITLSCSLGDIWCCSCMQISWLKVRFKLIKYVCSVEFSSICHLASQTSFIEHKPILSSNRFQQFHLSIHGSFRFREYDHGNGLYFANFYHKSSNITSFCESHFSVFILLYKSISNLLSIQLKKF